MKPESLEALVIDQSFGELPEEMCELLEAYLSRDPVAASEAERLRGAVGVTDLAVKRRPDIVRANGEMPVAEVAASSVVRWIRNAAIAASICLIGVAVFNFNSDLQRASDESGTPELLVVNRESPWAKYRIENRASEAGNSLSVRVE